MKRRGAILFGALVAMALGVAALWPRGPREPVYQGIRLSRWIDEARPGFDGMGRALNSEQQREACRKAIQALGTNSLPWLMHEFTHPGSKWRTTVNLWIARHTYWRFRFSADSLRWQRAVEGLEMVGPQLAPVLPELARCLDCPDRPNSISDTARAMASAGESALPYFLEGMASTKVEKQSACISGLGVLAQTTVAAVPHLVALLHSSNQWMRVRSLHHLRHVTSCPELTIPALTAALSDSDAQVQRLAEQSLDAKRNRAR